MKKGILCSIVALVLVLGMAFTLPTPVGAATVTFSGNVTLDFTGDGILTIPDFVGDVGLPSNATAPYIPAGTVSGWDMVDLRLTYDAISDILYVGINTYGICGDADGDGYPGGTSAWLSGRGGIDRANLGNTENVAVYFDLDKDGTYDVIAGVPDTFGSDVTDFTVAYFAGDQWTPEFGADLPSNHQGDYYANPSAAAPDFEFTIEDFSTLPGSDASVGEFILHASLRSRDDDGIGEDYIHYEQNPHTEITISSSAPKVAIGGTVDLTVGEYNSGNVDLCDPYVELLQGATHLDPLGSPSGDTFEPGVLNVGENWTWTITSNAINAATTFTARGSGTAPGEFPVDYLTDPLEQDYVDVNTMNPNTVTDIITSATMVDPGDSVSLSVTEKNTGGDPLTIPYVEVWKGPTTPTTHITTLTKGDSHWVGGDTNANNKLDPTETWSWTNIDSGPITATTKFFALGFGTDSQGHEVSYDEGYPGERDEVLVTLAPLPPVGWETYPINKLAVLAPWIALTVVIITGASLLVLRRRRT